MKAKDGNDEIPVYARAATWEGMERFLEENKSRFENIKIVVWNAHESISEVESTEAAIAQQEFIQDLMEQNLSQMQCLHCGKMISTNDSYTVELDEFGLRPAVGNVHHECLRTTDRIIGRMMFPEATETKLVNFDYRKWFELLKNGQGFLTGAIRIAKDQPGAIISWNRTHQHQAGDYCIRMTLSDGSYDYLKIGKDIHRFTAEHIDQEVEQMNKDISVFGMLTPSKSFGNIEYLESTKAENEQILPITQYTKVRYSNQFEAIENALISDYAPIGLLQTLEGETIIFDRLVPLISDVTLFDDLYESWMTNGLVNGPCTLKIIENDKDLDFYLIGFFNDGLIPVVNPKFDERKALISGVRIVDIWQIMEQGQLRQNKKASS